MTSFKVATWIVITAAVTACGHKAVEDVETEAAPVVQTTTVAPRTFEATVSASGLVSAAPGADWTITAPEAARIVEIPKAEGDRVKPGDLLVRFDSCADAHERLAHIYLSRLPGKSSSRLESGGKQL